MAAFLYIVTVAASLYTLALLAICLADRSGAVMKLEADQQPDKTGGEDHRTNHPESLQLWRWALGLAILGAVGLISFGVVSKFESGAWTAAFSLVLVACTSAQAIIAKWQRDIMGEQIAIAQGQLDLARDEMELTRGELAVSRIAAESAKKSADMAERALHVVERGRLILEDVEAFVFVPGKRIAVSFMFKNNGRTELLTGKAFAVQRLHKEALPTPPDYSGHQSSIFHNATLGPGESRGVVIRFDEVLKQSDFDAIMDAKLTYSLFGVVEYVDVFGNPHQLGFCRHYTKTHLILRDIGLDDVDPALIEPENEVSFNIGSATGYEFDK